MTSFILVTLATYFKTGTGYLPVPYLEATALYPQYGAYDSSLPGTVLGP
jgi:hypothetical protein